jgi:WD40 repeat protein
MREVTQKELRLWYNQFHYFQSQSPDLKSLVDHAEVRDIFKQMV